MKTLLLSHVLITFSFTGLYAQNTLFDNSRVSSVYIEISPDSLKWIMDNVLSDHYFKAMFIYDYGTKRDTLKDVGFRLRGNTSRVSKKKSFKISFNEYVSGRKYQEVKKINLNGQHNDPTLIREKLFYDYWKNTGLAERRTSFVKMYINQAYYGLYTNLEEFDKDWLQRVYGEKSGNLYKCTCPADLVYHGTNQGTYKIINSGSATGGRAYDLQTNEVADDYSDLVDLITTLNQPADEAFAILISQKINVDGFLRAFALDVATGNWDDYM
jgi:spore coat protein CotH